jgi:hypothetical protein
MLTLILFMSPSYGYIHIAKDLVHTFSIFNLVATDASSCFTPQIIVNTNRTADLNIILYQQEKRCTN